MPDKPRAKRPDPNQIAEWLKHGIGVLDDNETLICLWCGTFLYDVDRHITWHKRPANA
jgi:hypothetical protein